MDEHKRIYGHTRKLSHQQLQEVFHQLDYVELALLFGSRAVNREQPSSDYDFAVIVDSCRNFPWGTLSELRNVLAEQLRLPDKDFDIVDLSTADSAVISGILAGYVLLKGDKRGLQRILEKDS